MDKPLKQPDTRLDILEVEFGGLKKTVGSMNDKLDSVIEFVRAMPKHTSIVDQLRIIGLTISICTAFFTGAQWWLNSNIAPDRQKLETVVQQSADLAVMRYRLDQLERGGERTIAKNP